LTANTIGVDSSAIGALSFGLVDDDHPGLGTLFTLVFFETGFAGVNAGFALVCVVINIGSRGKIAFGTDVTCLAFNTVWIDSTTCPADVSSGVIGISLKSGVWSANETT
jgi:hypothetical protein